MPLACESFATMNMDLADVSLDELHHGTEFHTILSSDSMSAISDMHNDFYSETSFWDNDDSVVEEQFDIIFDDNATFAPPINNDFQDFQDCQEDNDFDDGMETFHDCKDLS